MENLKKVAYQGYVITENGRLSDDGVIEYSFVNYGRSPVQVNGIILQSGDAVATTIPGSNMFKETINPGEKNGKYYEIKFTGVGTRLLQVIEKRYIY